MQKKVIVMGIVAGVLALVAGGLCLAQPPQGGGQGGPGFGGPGGNFDPAQMRQRMMERWKEQLGADDDAWKVIEPRLTKVMEINRQTMVGGMGGMFGMRGMRGMRGQGGPGGQQGRGGPQGDRPRFPGDENREPSAVEKAQEALETTLDNESASADTIKQQLTALRQAREKAKQELAAAQQSLREILTVRQEALLVLTGMLN